MRGAAQRGVLRLAAAEQAAEGAGAHGCLLAAWSAPRIAGNYEGPTRLCVNGAEFSSVVAAHEGWDLVNEGDQVKQK